MTRGTAEHILETTEGEPATVMPGLDRREDCPESINPEVQMVSVVMRQNLHELPDLVRFAHQWGMARLWVQHLRHDFGEVSLPAHYRPMREFVQEQTLLEDNPSRVDHYFAEARRVAAELNVDLRLPRTQSRPHPSGTPGRQHCSWP